MGLKLLLALRSFQLLSAQESCYEAHYVELPEMAEAKTLRQFVTRLMDYAHRNRDRIQHHVLRGDAVLLRDCHDHLRMISLVYSLYLELGGFPVAKRYSWMRKAVHRHWVNWLWLSSQSEEGEASVSNVPPLLYLADQRLVSEERGLAAFVDLGRSPLAPQPAAVRSVLRDLTAMICLEFRRVPSKEQLHFFHQSGLLSFVGAVGSPAAVLEEESFLHRLATRDQFRLAESCRAHRLPFVLGFADEWSILPLHPDQVLEELRHSITALTLSEVSAVSMRHKFLDITSSSDYMNAHRMGTASPFIRSQLYPMYGTPMGRLTLGKLYNLVSFRGKPDPDELEEVRCGELRCYAMPHNFSDLLDGDIYLYRAEDASPATQSEEKEEATPLSLFLESELHLKPFLRTANRSYSLLAEVRNGLFQRKDAYEVFNYSTMPIAVVEDEATLRETMGEVVLLPVDFFGRCREQFSWLLVDLVQVLELTLNQGLRNVTLVEPLLHHVVEEALYTHAEQWEKLTAGRTQEDAMREICQLTDRDETFRFDDVFDVGHFFSELHDLGVQKTISLEGFLDADGAIDTLFLLNAAFQPGGAWVQKLFAEPLLHCQDNPSFNRVVEVFDGRKVFVKRLVCLSAETTGQDASQELDGQKFARELVEALRHGNRLAFQLYFWSGPERQRMSLHLSQMAHLPSLWRAFKFLPALEELADEVIRGFLGGEKVPFLAVHWKWRDMSAGGLLEYFDHVKARRRSFAARIFL